MRVLESLLLRPDLLLKLLLHVAPHLLDGWRRLRPPPVDHDGLLQLAHRAVREGHRLPRLLRVHIWDRLRRIRPLVRHRNQVRDREAIWIIDTPYALLPRIRDLLEGLGHLDLREADLIPIHRHQLIHRAEHRIALRRDQPLADTEGIDARALLEQRVDRVLIEAV